MPDDAWTQLAARCEAASGPDREIDYEIARHLGWTLSKMKGDARPYWRKPGETLWFMRATSGPPSYTASVDAVLALISETLPGVEWCVDYMLNMRKPCAWVQLLSEDPAYCDFLTAATPALALLRAYCGAQARAAQPTS